MSRTHAPSVAAARSQRGVMLIEALVAILIFSIGIIALLGLQANSIVQVSQAKYRTDASYLANQIIARMWVDQANLASYAAKGYAGRQDWDTLVSSTLPAGDAAIDVAGNRVTVTVRWRQPEDPTVRRYRTVATIMPSS
jgi:type IV pilus assembly protein PilV